MTVAPGGFHPARLGPRPVLARSAPVVVAGALDDEPRSGARRGPRPPARRRRRSRPSGGSTRPGPAPPAPSKGLLGPGLRLGDLVLAELAFGSFVRGNGGQPAAQGQLLSCRRSQPPAVGGPGRLGRFLDGSIEIGRDGKRTLLSERHAGRSSTGVGQAPQSSVPSLTRVPPRPPAHRRRRPHRQGTPRRGRRPPGRVTVDPRERHALRHQLRQGLRPSLRPHPPSVQPSRLQAHRGARRQDRRRQLPPAVRPAFLRASSSAAIWWGLPARSGSSRSTRSPSSRNRHAPSTPPTPHETEVAAALVIEIAWGQMADEAILTVDVGEGHLIAPLLDLVSKDGKAVVTSIAPMTQVDIKANLHLADPERGEGVDLGADLRRPQHSPASLAWHRPTASTPASRRRRRYRARR